MNEIEIGEKLSALHDGELESSEIDELIDFCLLYTSPSPRA